VTETPPGNRIGISANLVILIPVLNDWDAVWLLLEQVDRILSASALLAEVILVDDGSTLAPPARFGSPAGGIARVEVLTLRRNVGHQRALALGLAWLADHTSDAPVVVMDGDGEDDPRDIPRLFERFRSGGGRAIVFAERTRRSESLLFRVFYDLYRLTHFAITGIRVRVGNFSIVPRQLLLRLVVVSELWNHYAAAVFKSRLPRESIPTTRARRLAGRSRMNFVALVVHGLSALSVHSEVIGVRLLVACGVAAAVIGSVLVSVVAVRLLTDLAIPGWASILSLTLAVLLSQIIGLALSFVFLILGSRSGAAFVPARDYHVFIESCHSIEIGALRSMR
jgi:glycosyltransferase involved in cell wall biosynthesis